MSQENITKIGELGINAISDINNWALVTAGSAENCNTMTVSWGSMGVLWGKPVVTIYIRNTRHTLGFLDDADSFTLSFFDEGYHDKLDFCGRKSGRDFDKVKECGFTVKTAENGAVYFDEAKRTLVCKKLYAQNIEPEHIIDKSILDQYVLKDYHRVFIGEIIEVIDK